MDEIIDYWANINDCVHNETESISPYTNVTHYYTSDSEMKVRYIKINDWGHGWPHTFDNRGISASEAIWSFFSTI